MLLKIMFTTKFQILDYVSRSTLILNILRLFHHLVLSKLPPLRNMKNTANYAPNYFGYIAQYIFRKSRQIMKIPKFGLKNWNYFLSPRNCISWCFWIRFKALSMRKIENSLQLVEIPSIRTGCGEIFWSNLLAQRSDCQAI